MVYYSNYTFGPPKNHGKMKDMGEIASKIEGNPWVFMALSIGEDLFFSGKSEARHSERTPKQKVKASVGDPNPVERVFKGHVFFAETLLGGSSLGLYVRS